VQYSVAYNWDPALLEEGGRLGIGEFYCKFGRDVTGGARPGFAVGSGSWSALRQAVRVADPRGIALNYVLAGSAQGAAEFTPGFRKRYLGFVRRLVECGVRVLTLAHPYLLEVTRHEFPDLRLVVSSLARVHSVQQALFWERLGANVVIVVGSREARVIQGIRRSTSLDVEVIANHLCWPFCPMHATHAAVATSASAEGSDTGLYYPGWCDAYCQLLRLDDPMQLVRASWIRPQDVPICERWGVSRMKLCERIASTADMVRIIEAYTSQRHEGNLVDLFPKMRPGPSHPAADLVRGTGVGVHLSLGMTPLIRRAYAKPRIHMDAAAFDGFLEGFERRDCRTLDCEACGHCRQYAEKAVRILDDTAALKADLGALIGAFRDGTAYQSLPTFVLKALRSGR